MHNIITLFLVILFMSDGFLVLLALFLSFDLFIISSLRIFLIWGFWLPRSHFFFLRVCVFSTVVNSLSYLSYHLSQVTIFSSKSFFETFKIEVFKISVNQLFWFRFLESSFEHGIDHMMMITKTSFKRLSIFKRKLSVS